MHAVWCRTYLSNPRSFSRAQSVSHGVAPCATLLTQFAMLVFTLMQANAAALPHRPRWHHHRGCVQPRAACCRPATGPLHLCRLQSRIWRTALCIALNTFLFLLDFIMCRPTLLQHPTSPLGTPTGGVFKATQLRHPAGIAGGACGSFVPNDISLGGEAPGFILLTGPNMGGKSTLLRQVCLAAVLAQVRIQGRVGGGPVCGGGGD
jgi:hypothetical protein